MEKEKKLSPDPIPAPSSEFLRTMSLLEQMEMLRMMQEFQLDGQSEKAMDSDSKKKAAAPGDGSKR